MKTKNIFIVLIISFIYSNNSINTGYDNKINYNFDNQEGLNVEINIGDINLITFQNKDDYFLRINLENAYPSSEIGAPELPQINRLIEIPHEANIRIEIINDEFIEYNLNEINSNAKIFPVQPSLSKSTNPLDVDFIYKKDIYTKNDFISNDLVQVVDKGMLREVRIGNLMVSPFEYNPITNVLKIHQKIDFNVYFDNANISRTNQLKSSYASPYFEPIFENTLVNYQSPYLISRENDFIEDNVTYVIIANQSFNGYLDEFIEWKTKKGYDVIIAYTNEIGSSASSIRGFIQEQYQNPPTNMSPASFVLLVGDTQQIPASYSSGGHVSDLDYCNFTGDDMPEVLCGRFSAQTPSHLQAQIDKTLEYEQYLMPDPSFLGEVIMISGVDASYAPTYGNGQINYGNNYYFNSGNGINSNTFLYPASGSSGSQILNLANQGAAFINYTAHGWESGWADPEFDVSDANNMSNANKYPTMVGNCCLTNAFDSATCFGEALLRKSNGGAIGYIGGSDVTYWNEDYWWGVGSGNISSNPSYGSSGEGAYDGMFHENNENNWAVVNSAVIMVGNLAVVQANGMDDYYWEIYHLMGDPSLSTYLGVPDENNVEHPIFLSPGSSEVSVSAEPFSYVGLTKDNQLIGSGIIGESGVESIALTNTNNPGEIIIVVTGQNIQPYTGTILLTSPDGAYVTVNEVVLNDGNDEVISIGEEVLIQVSIENVGSEIASDIAINLTESSLSPYISITNGYSFIDYLENGVEEFAELSFIVNNDAPYGHSFSLTISMETESNDFTTSLDLNVEQFVESFESGNWNNLDWEFLGDENWTIDVLNSSEGSCSAKSGLIDNNMTSDIMLTVEIVEDGNISFDKKVSCEDVGSYSGNYYDYLAFYIDNVEQAKWAGEIDWSQNSFPVSSGEHTFLWRYNKDQGVIAGQDAVWIDNIILPPTFNESAIQGDINNDGTINVQDIIVIVNIILSGQINSSADINNDGNIDILDVIVLVNMILQN